MGTNYYAIPKVSPEEKEKILKAIYADQMLEAKRMIPERIHIGKSSSGWQFLFNHNNWEYFQKSLESLEKFLDGADIEDEYRTPITTKEFWEMVNSKKDGIDGKEYYTNWDKYNKDPFSDKIRPKPSYIRKDYDEEIHFGLRFSISTEFS